MNARPTKLPEESKGSIVTILEQAKTSQEADGTNEKEKERGEKINHCQ